MCCPFPAAPQRMYHSNIFQIPNPGCLKQQTANKLLGFGLLFDGRWSCRCRFWGGFSDSRGSHWIIQTEAPATKQKWCKRRKGCSCFVGMILRAPKRISYKEATHRFLIFFTKALTALTILLIRTCHQNNRWVSAFKQFSGLINGFGS